jgi:hypothetical protein
VISADGSRISPAAEAHGHNPARGRDVQPAGSDDLSERAWPAAGRAVQEWTQTVGDVVINTLPGTVPLPCSLQ